MHHAIQLATLMGFQVIAGYAVVRDARFSQLDRAIFIPGELSEYEQIKHIMDCIGQAIVSSSSEAALHSDEANHVRAREWASMAQEWIMAHSVSKTEVLS